MELNRIYNMDVRDGMKALEDQSVNCCVTSPPYWNLRDYGTSGQIGQEKTPEEFIDNLIGVFRDVRRILTDEGTLWINIGDTYCSTAPSTWGNDLHITECSDNVKKSRKRFRAATPFGMKPKDMVGIPWMLAFALRADGWYLRQDIIWHKPNPMPESVTDRCTKSHEYIFLLSKSARYYYDAEAIKESCVWDTTGDKTDARIARASNEHKAMPTTLKNGIRPKKKGPQTFGGAKARESEIIEGDPRYRNGSEQWGRVWDSDSTKRNKRSVWTVTTKPFSEAHFATFPEDLIVDCIKAGCPIDGTVLDPFMGAGTTALVARKLNRNFIGFELNPEYIRIAERRLDKELGMFK